MNNWLVRAQDILPKGSLLEPRPTCILLLRLGFWPSERAGTTIIMRLHLGWEQICWVVSRGKVLQTWPEMVAGGLHLVFD